MDINLSTLPTEFPPPLLFGLLPSGSITPPLLPGLVYSPTLPPTLLLDPALLSRCLSRACEKSEAPLTAGAEN
jgi:hypothetical protein